MFQRIVEHMTKEQTDPFFTMTIIIATIKAKTGSNGMLRTRRRNQLTQFTMTIHQSGEEALESAENQGPSERIEISKTQKEFVIVGVGVPAPVHVKGVITCER